MSLTTVIGRGHSGTRAMSHTLSASGVYMGEPLNGSGDLLPPDSMYEACRVMARHVVHKGGVEWDFSKLHTMPIDPAFTKLVEDFLTTVQNSKAEHRGWKLPETTLVLPWIVRMFPDIRYIYWIRDPRDSIIGSHITDDLGKFGVTYDATDDLRTRRAISWKYQLEIVKATPKPKHWLTVRLEDFVLDQDHTLERLTRYLGIPMAKIPVKPEVVGRWKVDTEQHDFDMFKADLLEHHYEPPRPPAPRPPIRKAFVMSVNPGQEAEYEKRHRPIWPELQATLEAHGAHNYNIYLHPETHQLFAFVEVDSEERWNAIAQTDICKKWWAYMADMMPSNPDNSPVSRALPEVFHMD